MLDHTMSFCVGKIHRAATFHTGVHFRWVMQFVKMTDIKDAKKKQNSAFIAIIQFIKVSALQLKMFVKNKWTNK